MATVDDWSELITVDYNGGLGGEFFGLLLQEAINPNENIRFKSTNHNKYDFKPYDVFCDDGETTDISKNFLKKLFFIRRIHHSKNFDGQDRDIEHDDLIKKYNKVFLNEKNNFIDVIRNYTYDKNKHKFDGKLKIALFHDSQIDGTGIKNNTTLDIIFPKSKNIMLVCPDYHIFFVKFLLLYKVLNTHYLNKNSKEKKIYIIEAKKRFLYFDFYNFDSYPCLKIDMYSLLYEQKNYDKELSDLLGQDIVLDRQKISEYAQKNINIFKKYDLDINSIYPREYFEKKLQIVLDEFLSG